MYIIKTDPFTRVNDTFVSEGKVDCRPCANDITHPLITAPANSDTTRLRADFYKHVAMDVVTETVFDYPYPAITSKTLRPIACKRLFVIVGPPGILELLHRKGFITFGDYIDESYDSMQNPEDRLLAVTRTVDDFCKRDLSSIKQWMQQNLYRFEHNFTVLKNLRAREIDDFQKRLNEEF